MTNDEFCERLNDEVGALKFEINPYVGSGRKISKEEIFELTIDVPGVTKKVIGIRILARYQGYCIADAKIVRPDRLTLFIEAVYLAIRKIQKEMHE